MIVSREVGPGTALRRGAVLFLALSGLAAPAPASAGAAKDASSVSASGERASVLLVTFDTTRADHIGAYGYRRIRCRFERRLRVCPRAAAWPPSI